MKKNLGFHEKFPALWTRAPEPGHLVQIFDSVSVIYNFARSQKKAEEENEKRT
jgi:TATA-box binding protein (TBP) (component of TFIID and TFIIIB)